MTWTDKEILTFRPNSFVVCKLEESDKFEKRCININNKKKSLWARYNVDLGRIQIDYKQFRFSFRYFFYTDGELFLRGNGKYIDHGYGYAKEKNKERENAYYYVRSILKSVLEDS